LQGAGDAALLEPGFYLGREQTFVKHFVLEHYLERLAFKVGWNGSAINYIDGFAGPWRHEDESLRDTSPFIALEKLKDCRSALIRQGRKPIEIRCLFIERNPRSYALLERETRAASGPGIIAEAQQGDFEALSRHILRFASSGYRPFTFFFIDPTGWTGYGMSRLEALFNQDRSEILINFMTKDIKRFIDDDAPTTVTTFQDLFGIRNYQDRWRGLEGIEREDMIVATYCKRLSDAGNYPYVGSSIVLHPTDSRTHYHLIYAASCWSASVPGS
jgi:three-Cys-motif partner protein